MARYTMIQSDQSDSKAKNDRRRSDVGRSGRYLGFGISKRGPARSGGDAVTAWLSRHPDVPDCCWK
jgi:hypothetical protein